MSNVANIQFLEYFTFLIQNFHTF